MSKKNKKRYVDDTPFDYKKYLDKRLGPVKKPGEKQKSGSGAVTVVFLIIGLVVFLMVNGAFAPDSSNNNQADGDVADYTPESNLQLSLEVTIYSSTTCSCCHEYVAYLEDNGVTVNFIRDDDQYIEVKNSNGIPDDLWSCHTTLLGNYFSEGHVPLSVIKDMLDEQPEFDGISLPNMPAGSPGMGGSKDTTWDIYSIADGVSQGIYASI